MIYEYQEQLSGTVERLLFSEPEAGFYVFNYSFIANRNNCSWLSSYHNNKGNKCKLPGNWVTHPKFGKQFEAQHAIVQLPTHVVGLKKYLGSGLIKGIGPSYAEKLINAFGSSNS